jgi:hypothetical protein
MEAHRRREARGEFRIVPPLPPHRRAEEDQTLLVKEYRPDPNSYQLTNVTDDQIKFFPRAEDDQPEIEQACGK